MLLVIPGTWVRAPGPHPFPILFFQLLSHAGSIQGSIMRPSIQRATCPIALNQGTGSVEYGEL